MPRAYAYDAIHGVAVKDILPRLPVLASQFKVRCWMPLSSTKMLDNASKVFDKSGVHGGAMQPVVPPSDQYMYRGHPVSVTSQAQVTADNSESKADKAKHIYRGQVIED